MKKYKDYIKESSQSDITDVSNKIMSVMKVFNYKKSGAIAEMAVNKGTKAVKYYDKLVSLSDELQYAWIDLEKEIK